MEDGAEATPGLAFRDDLNTGIWSSAADTFNISTGGTERLELGAATVFNESGADVDFRIEGDTEANLFYVDAGKDEIYLQGQLGIGTTDTPGEIGLYLGDGTNPAAHIYANGGDHLYILANAYYAGGWKYQGSGEAGSLTIGSGNLTFNTAPTGSGGNAISWIEVFQAKNSNGDLSITNGNLVVASGKGISFDPYDNTDTANGSDSNLLDDYEEGRFEPNWVGATTAGDATYTNNKGKYTKIGNRVWCNGYTVITGYSSTAPTGNWTLTNLPFSSGSDADNVYATGSCMIDNFAFPAAMAAGSWVVPYKPASNDNMMLYYSRDGAAWGPLSASTDNVFAIIWSISYCIN